MATLALPLVAAFGATQLGITAGSIAMMAVTTAATFAGSLIDQRLFGQTVRQQGPRLQDVQIQDASEGADIYRCFGYNRVAGQLIWATRFREETSTTSSGGGKGGGGGGGTKTTTYTYFCSFAIALCEGPIIDVGRVWADGKLIDLTPYNMRVYYGDEEQQPDPAIVATEGADFAPAFRGTAYVVFDNMELTNFGNRIPQLQFEIFSFTDPSSNDLERRIRAVNIIPGAGEFVYAITPVDRTNAPEDGGTGWEGADPSQGASTYENRHTAGEESDLTQSLNILQRVSPNVNSVSLVVSWFGSDLRCGQCTIRPKVDIGNKKTKPWSWHVSGLNRGNVPETSKHPTEGFALYGGTPDDRSVFEAIQDMNTRGLNVVFYPFILMDIPENNNLTDPYTGLMGQPAFPWRGRITCNPAPGRPGSPDKTAAVRSQVNAFMGNCNPSHFGSWNGSTIPYFGPTEYSFRRMILHYAKLCAAAGGVHAFLIGTEMVGMTSIRDSESTFPYIDALKQLAAEVKSILPNAKVSYAADWSEYHSYRPTDGSNDVYFHLDALWSDPNIDFIGIDNYLPISDWRDVPGHLDSLEYDSIYDPNYLKANIEGGEYYDWYYASDADRDAQVRSPITEFTFGNKRIREWWANQHFNRPLGVVSETPTSWVPQSKPIWFTEFGCAAVDKGTNQPNVFVDPKSAESNLPHYSNGARDDLIQRAYLEAWIDYWDPLAGNNPESGVYAGNMITHDRMFVWTWDARPYPEFPGLKNVWQDADNWRRGHWLNGRLGQGTLASLVRALTKDFDVEIDTTGLQGIVMGYTLDRAMSAREALDALSLYYTFDAYESQGVIKFRHRGGRRDIVLTEDELVLESGRGGEQETFSITRGQETDIPNEVNLRFVDSDFSYNIASVRSRRLTRGSLRTSDNSIALVSDKSIAQAVADIILIDAWVMREKFSFILNPSYLRVDPTDIIEITLAGKTYQLRVESVGMEYKISCSGVRTDSGIYQKISAPGATGDINEVPQPVAGIIDFLDLPILTDVQDPAPPWVAIYANPWKPFALYKSPTTSGYEFDTAIDVPAIPGIVRNVIGVGTPDVWDNSNHIDVEMLSPNTPLSSADELLVLNGANTAAIKCANGNWEIVSWVTATPLGGSMYRLTKLLRGLYGTELAMQSGNLENAEFVILNSLTLTNVEGSERNQPRSWKFGPATHPIDADTYITVNYTPLALGMKPYAPAHVKAKLNNANADVNISWIRRTRMPSGVETWESGDAPLGEEIERYEVDIYNAAGDSVVRTITVDDQQFATYTEADQIADHGSPLTAGDTLKVDVYQISLGFGRGWPRQAIIELTNP